MCSLEQFKVDLKRLTDEVTTLEFDLDNRFFTALSSSSYKILIYSFYFYR